MTLNSNLHKKWLLIGCFAAVYIIWGSTYLAIRFALETIPPFLMAGVRFIISGSILFVVSKVSGSPLPTFIQVKNAAVIGFLLLVCGNGGVVYAEQMVPSGLTALIVTIEPLWIVIIMWVGKSGKAPNWYVWLGLFLGMLGMVILLGINNNGGDFENISLSGFIILIASTFCWALGSIYAVKASAPKSPIMATSVQMLAGGLLLSILSLGVGEWAKLHLEKISLTSLLSVIYLIFFGSIVGYTAYSYLTRTVSPSQVSTYAYVNPVIAVLLGTLLGNEVLTKQIIIATPILVLAVILLIWKPTPLDKSKGHLTE